KLPATARNNQLRAARAALNVLQINLEPLSRVIALALDLLAARHNTLSFAEVESHNVALHAGNQRVDNRADFVLELVNNNFALGFAQALQNNLLGGLSGNAAKIFHALVHLNHAAQLGVLLHSLSVL